MGVWFTRLGQQLLHLWLGLSGSAAERLVAATRTPVAQPQTPSWRRPQVLVVASDDGRIKCYSTVSREPLAELSGHEDAVQAVALDTGGRYLVTAASDCTFKLWS